MKGGHGVPLSVSLIRKILTLALANVGISRGMEKKVEIIVNASARPPRLAGLPTVGTCKYRYTGI